MLLTIRILWLHLWGNCFFLGLSIIPPLNYASFSIWEYCAATLNLTEDRMFWRRPPPSARGFRRESTSHEGAPLKTVTMRQGLKGYRASTVKLFCGLSATIVYRPLPWMDQDALLRRHLDQRLETAAHRDYSSTLLVFALVSTPPQVNKKEKKHGESLRSQWTFLPRQRRDK